MKKLVLVVAMFMFVCGGSFLVKAQTATVLFLFNGYFFSSGQGQGCPIALKVGRCASTFRR